MPFHCPALFQIRVHRIVRDEEEGDHGEQQQVRPPHETDLSWTVPVEHDAYQKSYTEHREDDVEREFHGNIHKCFTVCSEQTGRAENERFVGLVVGSHRKSPRGKGNKAGDQEEDTLLSLEHFE